MQRNMYFERYGDVSVAAVEEDGRLAEFHVQEHGGKETAGDIYKGRIVTVLEGMQAAFVAFGKEKNGYLYAGNIPRDYAAEDVNSVLRVKEGDEVMVQVAKPTIGSKGARLTMDISLVGKNVILLPGASFCSVSRKIGEGEDREAMLAAARKLSDGNGIVLRTQARGVKLPVLRDETKVLEKIYAGILEKYAAAAVGDCVYREADLPVRLLRDFEIGGIDRICVDNEETAAQLERVFAKTKAGVRGKLVVYRGEREMFDFYGLQDQVAGLFEKRVPLENGAYLVIDRTEALTAVDVNTGHYTGETALEDTAFRTNILAARETARQVRLRGIGGIVVVDFIDMASAEHRAAVTAELELALAGDRAKCNMSSMTEFGLVQFTRKKVKRDNMSLMTKPCPHCNGTGTVLSPTFQMYRILTAVRRYFSEGYRNVIVEMNAAVYAEIVSTGKMMDALRNPFAGRRVYMIPHKTFPEGKFTIRGDNNAVLTLPETAKLLY